MASPRDGARVMRHNLLVVASSSLTVLLVGALFFVGVPIFDLIELKTYDLRLRSRGELQPTPAVTPRVAGPGRARRSRRSSTSCRGTGRR